jgi:hypothetical protein
MSSDDDENERREDSVSRLPIGSPRRASAFAAGSATLPSQIINPLSMIKDDDEEDENMIVTGKNASSKTGKKLVVVRGGAGDRSLSSSSQSSSSSSPSLSKS